MTPLAERRFTLSSGQYQQIVEAAEEGQPFEVCGLIGGWNNIAHVVIPLPNVANEPRIRYQVDAKAFVAAYRQLERAGDEVIGLYHSHPRGAPIPSAVDIAEAGWPEVTYLIVGFNPDPTLAAWSIWRGQVTPIRLDIQPDQVANEGIN